MNDFMHFKNLITESISEVENELHENELAYLALTSKVELPFRDKLAYILHKKIDRDLFVAREWPSRPGRSIDIAIIDKNKIPSCLIELKATNTQNNKNGKVDHIEKHLKSLENQLEDISKKCDTYFGIFLAAHPTKILEYNNSAIKNYRKPPSNTTPQHMLEKYNLKVENFFSQMNIERFYIDLGNFHGVPVKSITHLIWNHPK